MSKGINTRPEAFYVKWDLDGNRHCACLVKNPLCKNYKNCEELEHEISNITSADELFNEMSKHSKYKKVRGRIREMR